MTWRVEFLESAERALRKLHRVTQRRIVRFLRERIAGDEDPRRLRKPMRGQPAGCWVRFEVLGKRLKRDIVRL